MINRDVVEIVIFNNKGEVLLQKKTLDYPALPGGYWSFFGGEVENGEPPMERIKKEIEEEIGVTVENIEEWGIEDYKLDVGFFGKRYIFKGKFNGNLSEIRLGEGGGFALFEEEELENIKIHEDILKTLKEFFASESFKKIS